MKRAWTKKVKSLPSFAFIKNALERQLQPQRQVKRRIFRASATALGLTVSIGTPNLALTQANLVPESINSTAPIQDSTAPEKVQTLVIVPPPISPAIVVSKQITAPPLAYRSIPTQPIAKIAAPIQQQSVPAVQINALEAMAPTLQPSTLIKAEAPVVKQDVRAILRQHQQTTALEQPPVVSAPLATQTNRLIAQLKVSKKADINQFQATEIVPTQVNTDISRFAGQQEAVAVDSEANSAWTAKQRLLVERLKTKETFTPALQEEAAQVSNNINLDQPVTTSQPTVAIPAPIAEVENLATSEAPVVAAKDESRKLEETLVTEAVIVPAKEPNNQALVTPQTEIAQPSAAITPQTEELAQTLPPVFVIPDVTVAQEQVITAPTEVKKGDEQVTVQETPEKLRAVNFTPVKEVVPSINEPIIVSSAPSEYQVKPGDTLTTIASEHRLPLPKIADFNRLQNPDLLLVDQRLKIPALSSMKTKVNVAVLPPIKSAQPIAKVNNLPASALQPENNSLLVSAKEVVPVSNSLAPVYTGVGGSISGEEVETKPLEKTALNTLQAQYAQKLQNDVQKLQQKYSGQNSSFNRPVQAVKGEVLLGVAKPSSNIDNDEPVNPEFRVAQTYQDLKPVTQKQLLNKVNYTAPANNVTGKVATAPASGDNAEETFSGRQVTPELPPLDPAMNYLPQPNGVAPLNGYIWPAKGALTSKYGYRWGRMHRGIDIAAPVGTPIFAAASGVVIKSGWNKGGYGNLVDIQHADGTLTRYAHNYRLLVQPGQFVDQGQQISLMGNTGRSTGPHLHFEVRPSGKGAVNPIALLPKVR